MKRILVLSSLVLALLAWVIPTDALAQRRGGGSFGGSALRKNGVPGVIEIGLNSVAGRYFYVQL